MKNQISKLNKRKATQSYDILTRVIIENADIFSDVLYNNFKNSIVLSNFPRYLNLADITHLNKKGEKTLKENHRPVSILPNLSKIYEKIMFTQMPTFFESIFSRYQCGFRKGFGTQQCVLAKFKKWKRSIDKGKTFAALLTDLSKAFNCLNDELLRFTLPVLKLIQNYLSHRK